MISPLASGLLRYDFLFNISLKADKREEMEEEIVSDRW